jgi:hypothetical protein
LHADIDKADELAKFFGLIRKLNYDAPLDAELRIKIE